MRIFITGTDTNIGKTLAAAWICTHTGYDYFKPIQTGSVEGLDSDVITHLTASKVHQERYMYKPPLSPHQAAKLQGEEINIDNIILPEASNLIVEGAGGLLVPINQNYFMIDLIKHLSLPIILVASSRLGTINHTLLSIQAIQAKNISILGVIVSGELNADNCEAIEFYGKTKVLFQIPYLARINKNILKELFFPPNLQQLFKS